MGGTRRKPARAQSAFRGSVEHEVASWGAFVSLVTSKEFEDWAFRGERSADWPLMSSLSRRLLAFVPDRSTWATQELRAIRIFRRKAHHFLDDLGHLDTMFDCVGHMQQHGAPTRLIDLSKSPFVAAFFALSDALDASAVWAVNTPELTKRGRRRTKIRQPADDPRVDDNFESFFVRNSRPFLWAGEPFRMNRRLMFQAGTFLVPGVLDLSIEEIAAAYPRPDSLLHKFILPSSIRREGMAALYRMNISHATLFPDLEGLARSLAYELETKWGPVDSAD